MGFSGRIWTVAVSFVWLVVDAGAVFLAAAAAVGRVLLTILDFGLAAETTTQIAATAKSNTTIGLRNSFMLTVFHIVLSPAHRLTFATAWLTELVLPTTSIPTTSARLG